MTKFELAPALDLQKVKSEISFKVTREKVFTEDEDRINKLAMTRYLPEGKKVLGLASPRREVIQYETIMDWVLEEFDRVGVNYKLQESSLIKKSDDLYQQYLFDLPVETPDNQDISAMLILKGSHIGTPLKIQMGTYRFVCSNGVTVGNTIDSFSLKAKDLNSLLTYNLKDEIARGMEKLKLVSTRYKELANEPMNQYLLDLFQEPVVPVALKKSMFEYLAKEGSGTKLVKRTIKNEDFLTSRIINDNIINGNSETIMRLNEPFSAWKLYNNATDIVTHETRSEVARTYYYNSISQLFSA